jgi:glycosyltransferase involved in cell wall biosynthesis
MNLHVENINLSSNSGPNSFANKLIKYIKKNDVAVDHTKPADAHLCFIESNKVKFEKPMFLRLDGIYFNIDFDYQSQNSIIKRTYEIADGIIFQSEFNRDLTFKYFGIHKNYTIIHNGADCELIDQTPELQFDRYENLWCCASSWRPHKRLGENIRYFLEHSKENDGLMIAGKVSKEDRVIHDRIHYVGHLNQRQLFSLYKKSKFFIHLAWLDHCPNVVVDARACGCQIICSSAGGTKEIAGSNAIVIEESTWDYTPVRLYSPPIMDFNKKTNTGQNNELKMNKVSEKYKNFIFGEKNA